MTTPYIDLEISNLENILLCPDWGKSFLSRCNGRLNFFKKELAFLKEKRKNEKIDSCISMIGKWKENVSFMKKRIVIQNKPDLSYIIQKFYSDLSQQKVFLSSVSPRSPPRLS